MNGSTLSHLSSDINARPSPGGFSGRADQSSKTSRLARPMALAAIALLALTVLTIPAQAQRISFADMPLGAKPKDFEPALTGSGQQGEWTVVEDATAEGGRALAQSNADPTDYRFPLAIYMPTVPSDVEVTVRFKPVSGQVDRSGGVIVRLVDRNNYYVARANVLEENVRFYRVVAGRRQQLATAHAKITTAQWHTLSLRAQGDRFTVSFDGKPMHTTTDKTFASPGKIGLWTKADSVTRFDWIDIKPQN
ncbi:MAG: family 16 glycoside hydrolase [Variibacter sp.]